MVEFRFASMQELIERIMYHRYIQISINIVFWALFIAFIFTNKIYFGILAVVFKIISVELTTESAINSLRLEIKSKNLAVIEYKTEAEYYGKQ